MAQHATRNDTRDPQVQKNILEHQPSPQAQRERGFCNFDALMLWIAMSRQILWEKQMGKHIRNQNIGWISIFAKHGFWRLLFPTQRTQNNKKTMEIFWSMLESLVLFFFFNGSGSQRNHLGEIQWSNVVKTQPPCNQSQLVIRASAHFSILEMF